MWHKPAIASRRRAPALVAAFILLVSGAAPAYAEAPFCSLRDPSHQIYDMYPKATGFRSVVRDITNETQVAVDQKIPFPLLQGELGQHTLYVPVAEGAPLGYIQIRSELTEWGLAEIVWALSIQREVSDFRFQRCRGQACKSIKETGVRELLQGLDKADLIALLDDKGQLLPAHTASMNENERMLASVLTRSAIKVIAVIESGWPSTVAELAQNQTAP